MKAVPFKDLETLVGEKIAIRLCRTFGGMLIPSPLQVLRAKRDAALLADWEAMMTYAELSAKYGLPISVVRGKITKMLKE